MLWLLAASLFAAPDARAGKNDEAAIELRACLSGFRGIHARYEQVIEDADGSLNSRREGKLLSAVPNRLLLEVERPFTELLWLEGGVVRRYQPDLEQMTIDRLAADNPLPALLAGDISFLKNYRVVSTPKGYLLLARDSGIVPHSLHLSMRRCSLRELRWEDNLGAWVSLRLTRHLRLPSPRRLEAHFAFEPPQGTTLIDHR